ncbi:class I poly(R)-hydroxyalkanoic acid synthase [Paraburkholderia sp. MMS20-SJTR3]|uniref:Class I poly(R)-hydroxyalkanoic acid synthase n=1 Tax=Paraburkholderia sejongensis TaxID=2886946 RepID=A0ABS8JXW6_9BURK|nr:class I poly(R)-hydroxyalkanoic acid synthase [Paraburkholderia sp. MMS20-SJTR3]MCC8394748.1 class I poly(R)-hydroxyalkanoic acid synthase [Paraburkholderia sp. MMS20-SJTR3]
MRMPFSTPHELSLGWLKTGFDFWRVAPVIHGDFAPAAGDDSDAVPSGKRCVAMQASAACLQQHTELWSDVFAGVLCARARLKTVAETAPGDRRFQADDWSSNGWYSLLKQSYLINARMLGELVEATVLDEKDKHKLRFFTQQLIDCASPANFAATNPEALRDAVESGGTSLLAGVTHLLEDIGSGAISITDRSAFEVGHSVAASSGSVVYENELFQLIQYAPLTPKVAERPLVIVPPCINKFYILDLQPENSFVRFAVEQGLTVFVVSWRNPEQDSAHVTWDAYLEDGVIEALGVARDIGNADKINVLGWCVGGTMLASALAILRARGDDPVASATLLTALLDFSEPGDLGVFIDEVGVALREQTIGRGGLLPGRELGFAFQTLRANDLIWPYVVNNYLKGKSAAAFDLLYWNADTTNLPGPMYSFYLRNMYLENNLCVPNRLTLCGTPVDLGNVNMPTYLLAAEEDHIVPWQSAYRSTQLLGGENEFVLGASGHIAGVINPASKNKRSYWTNPSCDGSADEWRAGAVQQPGSWWNHWIEWVGRHSGEQRKARTTLGNKQYKPIESAPGRYVKVRAA